MIGKYNFIFATTFLATTFLQSECSRLNDHYFKNWDASATSVPDTYLSTPKIIRRHGYPAEAHIIQSEDGYLLEYHRIPHAKNAKASTRKYPVLMHHGLLCTSIDWVMNGPGKALAYRLADEGYDVWLANARGNTYSRSHIALSPSDRHFWDYTFHEMGVYDVPAAIDHILKITSAQKLIYIGHSLGTTTFYAFATNRPEYSDKILTQISVAPVASIPHTTSIFRALVPIAKEIESMTDWYYRGAFLEHDTLTSLFCKYICGRNMFNTNICEQLVMFNLFGKDKQQFNTTLIPMITSHLPAGTSGKNMIHCSQLISSGGKFRNYDYGASENMKRYNSSDPPTYNISDIQIPMKFYYGKNDILADPTDVEILYQQVTKPMGLTLINYDKWNHIDFLWAVDVNKYFTDMVIEFVNNVTTKPDFVAASVEEALAQRPQMPVAQDVQFDEKVFNDRIAELPGFMDAVKEIPNTLKTNFETGFNAVKEEVDKKVEDVENAINDSIQKTAKGINDGIQKTTSDIHDTIYEGVATAERGVNASVKHIEEKIKEALEKLASVISNNAQ